jgi:hypothetical protein
MLKLWSQTDYPPELTSALHAQPHSSRDSKPDSARFNVFQRLVRQWEDLHPYNGAQILKIRGTVDLDRCRRAWLEALDFLNLGVVSITQSSYHHRCLNGEAMYHGVVLCPEGTRLDDWISSDLNRPFDPDGGVPFRPFIIQENGHFWMGLCYQHWVADSASIRMLIHEWFARQYDPSRASRRPIRFYAGGYLSLFGPRSGGCPPTEVLLSTLRWHSQFKKARRIEDREKFQDMSLRFSVLSAPRGLIEPLRRAARRLGVTVNDLFLAAIAQVCDQCVPAERRFRRRELAIGSIVDLRPSADQPLNDVFDLLLGFTSICCKTSHLNHWPGLIESVAKQTRQQKRGGLPLASCLRMAYGLVVGKYFSREKVIEFYRKRVPLAGANSNVNLNRCWAAKYAGNPVLDYIRVAPTGPMTPLVFATTTLGSQLSIGLTYRSAIIPPAQAEIIGQKFLARLTEIAHCTAPKPPTTII